MYKKKTFSLNKKFNTSNKIFNKYEYLGTFIRNHFVIS